MDTLVSIVTPSFNQLKFLEETLRSVELQNYRPIHQIVIDGGSNDGTVELLQRWEKQDHGPGYSFEWISERDRGHADALNKGFDRVRGEIVGWLNSDDVYFDRDVIGLSVKALQKYTDVDVVHGECALISESSGLQMIWCFPKFDYNRALRGYLIPQPSVFFRRRVTDKHRFDASLKIVVDHIYWLQIGREHRFHKIHRIQAGDRDHYGRASRVSKTAMDKISRDLCAAYGGPERIGMLARLQDHLWRVAMRLQGLVYLIPLLTRKRFRENLAFPMWIDSPSKAIARQTRMRIDNRTDMGGRPSDGEAIPVGPR